MMEVYLRYGVNVRKEYSSVQFPTNFQPTTARTKNLSIVNADCCPKYPHDPPPPPVRPLAGQFSQFITELEYLVATATS